MVEDVKVLAVPTVTVRHKVADVDNAIVSGAVIHTKP